MIWPVSFSGDELMKRDFVMGRFHPARGGSFLEGHHKHAERAQQARVISRHAHRERHIEEMTEACGKA